MKRIILLSLLILISTFFLYSPIRAEETAETKAIQAAEAWLTLIDHGQYAQNWDSSAAYFKGVISKEKWEQTLTAVRAPLGKLISREVKAKQYARSLPGAPDGEYVVIQYVSSFENKKDSVETVTPMLDKDGEWRVSGYYIR